MAELHFLRPLWLAALPVGLVIVWLFFARRERGGSWTAVVDAALRPYVLAAPKALRESRWPVVAALLAWTLGCVAVAGPTWERLPVPVFRSNEALVVALDLSRSMDAGDVTPSRLVRAKLKLLDLLERRDAGQTGLVVFSTHGYTVTPLTTDTRTIAALTNALASDIMPAQGSSIRAGLASAAELLTRAELPTGDILLMTDAEVRPEDTDFARELASRGYRVHVLAVGTPEGAPIPQPSGGFVSDSSGRVVLPQVDLRALRTLAAAGDGRFATLAPDDSDLDALFPDTPLPTRAVLEDTGETDDRQADVWLDRGPWLVLVLLPLLALGFRRGWIAVWALVVLVPAPRAEAFEWADLWQRPDQRGYEAFEAERVAEAAELFEDGEWRAAAQYRAGQFEQSAETLSGLDTVTAHYNRGNALAKAGKLEQAIAAYDRALELDPEHADARYNRDLLEQFLKDNPSQSQQQQQGGEQQQQQGDSQGDSQSAGTSQQSADQSQQGDQSGDQQSQQSASDSSGSSQDDGQSNDGTRSDQQAAANDEQESQGDPGDENGQEEGDGDEPQTFASNDDLEEWASDQAAEQWLRRIPQDPGGLLRRKFLYQYQRFGATDDTGAAGRRSAEPW